MTASTLLESLLPPKPEHWPDTTNDVFLSLPLEERLQHLSHTRERGCLLIGGRSNSAEIYVREGLIVAAACNDREGEAALQHIVRAHSDTFLWLSGEIPSAENLRIPLMQAALRVALAKDEKKAGRFHANLDTQRFRPYLIADIDPAHRRPLHSPITILGRSADCDIPIDHPHISRRHCLFDWRKQGVFVRDLDSTCGTEVNGGPIAAGVYLESGDKIIVGTFRLTLYFG